MLRLAQEPVSLHAPVGEDAAWRGRGWCPGSRG
ncbi:hypothetical protein ACWDAZ_39135 [Streptomyces sp. NPDC001215]